jgi:phosphoglycolate phosphatase-like HAD superfamily hydrolase
MIGDSESDILAGKAARTITCGVTYGYGRPEDILKAKPDCIVGKARMLKSLIK